MSTLYMGIDPGKSGAVALIDYNEPYKTWATFDTGEFPEDNVAALIPYMDKIKGCVIEKVNAFGMGRTSAFTFGCNVGMWLGILAALDIPHQAVTPQAWQKAYFASPYRKGKDRKAIKKHSIKSAESLFDGFTCRIGRADKADALHLALAARDLFGD